MLSKTMGSPEAFEHRRNAIMKHKRQNKILFSDVSDEEVAQSFAEQLSSPSSDLFQFLQKGQIAKCIGDVLFIHGGLSKNIIG